MKVSLISVDPGREDWLKSFIQIYSNKISNYCQFTFDPVKPVKGARSESQAKKKKESDKILEKINTNDYVVVCDEKGQNLNSLEMSKWLEAFEHMGRSRLLFVIGGAYGLDQNIIDRSDKCLSLSKLTFNHHVAHIVLLEQIYRMFTIRNRVPYHNI